LKKRFFRRARQTPARRGEQGEPATIPDASVLDPRKEALLLVEGFAEQRNMDIAGIKLSFLPNSLPDLRLREKLTKPGSGEEHDHIIIHLHVTDRIPELPAVRYVFHSLWTLSQSGDEYIFQEGHQEPGALPNKVLTLGTDLREGDLYIPDGPSNQSPLPDPLGYPLNQALMILLLSRRTGILLHACGVDDNGSGYLFLGNSGHGKSTMARLWRNQRAMVLNDDRIVVREEQGKIWMYGTPWHGDFKDFSARGMPISKIFFLYPDKENRLIPLEGAKAVSMLLTRSFPPLWDKEGMIFTLAFCHQMVSAVPCYELHFKQDQSVADFVRNAV